MLMVMPEIVVAIPFKFMLFIMLKKSNCAERIASIVDATLNLGGLSVCLHIHAVQIRG